jgi:BASS family bile acid:Na+ symporter
LLKGNLALSISLSGLNSLLILISLPLIVNLALMLFVGDAAEISLPVMQTIIKIFFVIALPVFSGMMIRSWNRTLADKLEKPLRYILTGLLLSVFIIVIFFDQRKESASIQDYLEILPFALALNFASMLAGLFIAYFMKTGKRNSYTISVEVGLQNSALAIFVASTLLNNHRMAVVAVIYSSFTFFSTALFGYLAKKLLKAEK